VGLLPPQAQVAGGVVAVGGYLAEVMRLDSVSLPGVRIQLVFCSAGMVLTALSAFTRHGCAIKTKPRR
jgi:hypothetical protein